MAEHRSHRYHMILVVSAIVFLVAGSYYRKTLLEKARKASAEIENVNAALLSEVQQLRQAFEKTEHDELQKKIGQVLKKPMPVLVAVTPVIAPRASIEVFGEEGPVGISPVEESVQVLSGIVLNQEGLVLTGISSAGKQALIVFDNGNRSPAEPIGANPEANLALLKVKEGMLPVKPPPPGTIPPPEVQPGEPLLVLGRDERGERTVAVGRMSLRRGAIIALDAVCSPEQDGATVLNMQGDLIGIQLRSPDTNQCACLHMDMARAIAQGILRQSKPLARVGLQLQELSPELKQYYQVENGLLVVRMEEGGAAAAAGLLSGDLILEANGKPIATAAEFLDLVQSQEEGTAIQLRIRRGKAEKSVELQPVPPPENRFGAEWIPLSGGGLILRSVTEGSPAFRAGLSAGDVIVAIDEQAVRDLRDFQRRLQKKNNSGWQLWKMRRQDHDFYVAVSIADLT